MRTITKGILFIILSGALHYTVAQGVGIGEWRDMLPYNKTIAISKVGDRIYCATPYSLFYYNKEDYNIQRISKVNGLSDIGVNHISYNEEEEILVVAYTNTNLDFIQGDQFFNLPDIKRKEILGNKTINKILNKDKFAYLSCGFGIVVVDLEKMEIKDTYYIGTDGRSVNVQDMTYNDTALFAATAEGIYYADVNSPNLAYFANWTKMPDIPHPNGNYNRIHNHKGSLLINYHDPDAETDELFVYKDGNWVLLEGAGSRTKSIRTTQGRLIIAYIYFVMEYNDNLEPVTKIYTYSGDATPHPEDAITDGDHYWIADRIQGLVDVWGEGFLSQYIKPSGAPTSDIYSMSTGNSGDLWVVPGAMTSTWNNQWNGASVYSFINEEWRSYTQYNTSGLDTIRDVVCVAVDPIDITRVYAGTWSRGVLEFREGEMTNIYHTNNSSLGVNVLLGGSVVKVGGAGYDSQNNVWFSNSGAENILSVRRNNGTAAGEWESFNLGTSTIGIYVRELIVDLYDQKWMIARVTASNPPNPYYLYLFNEKNPYGQQIKGLKSGTGHGNIPGNGVFSIAVDKDGEVWVGTDEGIAVFYSPDRILTGEETDAQRILVDFDGYVQYLLETETVKAIAIDGANNKWIGTERAGVFKLSPDGTEQVHHFTAENSPLLSNSIVSLSINGETGEIYFGTILGLIAYKDDATEPNTTNSEVYAYPNPVKPGYTGPIAIKGLVNNANVKITDINGSLIYETVAEGGQAIWNGYNFDGRRARSGVYLVFISNDDGSESMVTKILFIN